MLLLLVMSVISANRMINDNTSAQFQSEALVSSATIANDLLLEIMGKRFDGLPDSTRLVTGKVTATTELSPYDSLQILPEWGPSAAERGLLVSPDTLYNGKYRSYVALNDVDDYDGYQRTVNYGSINGFIVKVKVYYVNASSPDTRTLTRTYFKKIEVSVEHPLYLPTVTYTALASY